MNENDYCVNKISDSPSRALLTENELKSIGSLFDYNQMNYANYQFYKLQTGELGQQHVKCFQYINGIKIFTNDLIFHFDQNNRYSSLSGDLIKVINLDIKPQMEPRDIIDLFINQISKDHYYSSSELVNNCFETEFGYYDLNAGTSYKPNLFTKAWLVKPKGKEYPIAYIDDSKNGLIYYFNGIINN
jgi:Zn-dependent metalloprotease